MILVCPYKVDKYTINHINHNLDRVHDHGFMQITPNQVAYVTDGAGTQI